MTYIEGFITPVPKANRDAYLEHAKQGQALMRDMGVGRMVECWEDDVSDRKLTDFRKAVQAEDGEAVLFSWFEYPDKAARDASYEKMMSDPRMEEMAKDMPFDGKRMIFGGFDTILDDRAGGETGYVDGIVAPVPDANKAAYKAMADKASGHFRQHGAVRVVEAWGDDVREGKVTDFRRAVQLKEGETVVYSFIEWPDKATRDAAWDKIMKDPDMQHPGEQPFDGKRMFWGGFEPIIGA